MSLLSSIGFLQPMLLWALLALPLIYWLLRATPPSPRRVAFPATRLLVGLKTKEVTPARSPWWLTLLRIVAAALVILALADPVLNPRQAVAPAKGPLVVAVDNGWAAAAHWREREAMLRALVEDAGRDSRSVLLVPTAGPIAPAALGSAKDALARIETLRPEPFAPDRTAAASSLQSGLAGSADPTVLWLSDGLDHGSGTAFAGRLAAAAGAGGSVAVALPSPGSEPLALRLVAREGKPLAAEVLKADGPSRDGFVVALSGRGQRLGEVAFRLGAGAAREQITFDLPLELRNQVTRLEITGERSTGAVALLDSRARWNRVGLVSGATREKAQPLLSPLFYLERALLPYAELQRADDGNSAAAIEKLIAGNVSVLVLADIGKLVGGAEERVLAFVEGGGILVRFAGPRLEQGGDAMLPVDLRLGGRSLGGALSWSTPQPLAPFEDGSLFAGLGASPEVTVSRQVLADPALLSDRTLIWARLADGTPLVTAERRKRGTIVLFHVTANSDWSSLPISGLFVDMLQRVMALSGLAEINNRGARESAAVELDAAGRLLGPIEALDGFGDAGPPPPTARPLEADWPADRGPDLAHPPGLYGATGAVRALNAVGAATTLEPLPALPANFARLRYRQGESTALKPLLLAGALALLLLDVIAVLLLQSGLRLRPARASAAAALLLSLLAAGGLPPGAALAQDRPAAAARPVVDDAFALRASLKPRLAYVLTGDGEADETSRLGLVGLGLRLTERTAFEPSEPLGIDIERDELSFFPVLYWPVLASSNELSQPALAKVDAFMKGGGMIVFDTRDALEALPQPDGSAGSSALQRLIGALDLPRLEPAPADHVMTKSFYLLRSFPGRYDGSALWVEAEDRSEDDSLAARRVDGVSSILITGNDLAGAWAIDDLGRPVYAVVPGGEEQREFAYRVGVNIVMYALTGNYKADQVHVPALLERLGQ